jgi:hypothetical protein
MTADSQLAAVRSRIAFVGNAFRNGQLQLGIAPRQQTGVVHFEIGDQFVDLITASGVPQRAITRSEPADWAIVVDDWSLIVPVGPPRGISELRGCGMRFGDQTRPIPGIFEIDRFQPEYFPERVPNSLLYVYLESHGGPVGSYTLAVLIREGLPEFAGDKPDPPPRTPRVAFGGSWIRYYEYRRGRAHQMSLSEGAWIDGNWKDLLVWHGLYDAAGFRRIYAEYPEIPDAAMDYGNVLGEVAKLPEAQPDRPSELAKEEDPGAAESQMA